MELNSETLFILVFLLISFLSWITEKFKAARQGQIESRTEEDNDWGVEEVTAQRGERPSGEASLKEIFQSLGIPVVEEDPRRTPPPLPDEEPELELTLEDVVEETVPPPLAASKPQEPKNRLSKAEQKALEAIQKGEAGIMTNRHGAGATRMSTVRGLLRHDQLRTAFVLKEILDSPRCREDLHT